jgi:hypothetical protein
VTQLEQGFTGGAKQGFEKQPGVALGQSSQLCRQGEDDVEVLHREQALTACSNPPLLGETLAETAMAIAAGIVGWMLSSAVAAHVQVATECGGPTARDCGQGLPLRSGQADLLLELGAVPPHDVAHVEAWPPGGCRA